jgi:chemotaxis protein CheZ
MANVAVPGQGVSVTAADFVGRLETIAEPLEKEVGRLAVLGSISTADKHLAMLRDELSGIGRLIAETRAEIAGLQASGSAHSHLVCASDELDAVVGATERAAVEIMVAAERSQEAALRLRQTPGLTPLALRDLDVIETAAVDVFMACSFQDLTGQRIRKVVGALSFIEKRVMALTLLWSGIPGPEAAAASAIDSRADAHLLNGPDASGLHQSDIDLLLGSNGAVTHVAQDDVDALFADFAKPSDPGSGQTTAPTTILP